LHSLIETEKPPFMTVHSVDLRTTGQFPTLLLDYLDQKPSLKEFYGTFPTVENAEEVIRQRADFSQAKRQTLVKVLEEQYEGQPYMPDFSIFLDEKTFTVTTGHQLNIFTGPLYVIYKIVTIIKLARKLKETYPEYNFVPVYWMASEDHDFAEIASFNLFGKTHRWEGDHKGAVGKLNPKELHSILKLLPDRPLLFAKAYLENDTLSDAVRCYMHELFGKEGLICLDADNADLKRHFLPVIKEELTTSKSAEIVTNTTSKLSSLGYHTPLHAREINLFYLADNLRERIVKEDNLYKVINTDLIFTEEEIITLTEEHPEYFSPNVVLRPLYEEIILPNLAYIGGPSEVPYWMQLKGVFDHYDVTFPMLIPRNFAMYITDQQRQRVDKLKVRYEDLFLDEVTLRKKFVETHSTNILDLNAEKESFYALFETILNKATAIDRSMEGAVKAEETRIRHSFENLEKRLRKAEERNHESEIDQLLALKYKLFPGKSSQERYDNFLNFYLNDPDFISKLMDAFDPLDFRYNVLIQEQNV